MVQRQAIQQEQQMMIKMGLRRARGESHPSLIPWPAREKPITRVMAKAVVVAGVLVAAVVADEVEEGATTVVVCTMISGQHGSIPRGRRAVHRAPGHHNLLGDRWPVDHRRWR